MIDHAVILAGGFGTRIRELFPNVPKPMIPLHGKPFLHWQLDLLAAQGFSTVTLCVYYMAEHIVNYFGDGAAFGLDIRYSHEQTPLGTGGAARLAAAGLNKAVLLINGDTFFELNYRDFADQHEAGCTHDQRIITMALAHVDNISQYGQVVTDPSQQVLAFYEKNTSGASTLGWINGGIYAINPDVWAYVPAHVPVSIERDTFPALLAAQQRIQAYQSRTRFVDMGTPAGYAIAANMLTEATS